MRRIILILLCLSLFSLTPLAAGNPQRKRARARTITVSGCIRQGVECLVLVPLGNNRQSYSVVRNRRLQVGRAYRITGTRSQVGFCMQGLPILSAQRIVPLRVSCPRTTDGQTNTNSQ